jgi:hypothetical protein
MLIRGMAATGGVSKRPRVLLQGAIQAASNRVRDSSRVGARMIAAAQALWTPGRLTKC